MEPLVILIALVVKFFVPLLLLIILFSIRVIKEYERGVLFTFGKFSSVLQPGWRIVVPVFQSMSKVDIRTKAVDVPHQEAITKDNIPVNINAVIYYRIDNAEKAILNVEDFFWAMSQLAQTTMRNAMGRVTLDELLQHRDKISHDIREIIDAESDPWGINVSNVELKDIILPQELKRTISKAAEADREAQAVVIKAQGDRDAADNLAEAARVLNTMPGAMHLRTLQTINDLSSDQSNTTVWMVPIEALEALKHVGRSTDK